MMSDDLGQAELAWARQFGQAARNLPAESRNAEDVCLVLDLIAVVAGKKPAAMTQTAEDFATVSPLLDALPARHRIERYPHWVVREETAGLPDWYTKGILQIRAQATVHMISAIDGSLPAVPPRCAAAEAALLGYPSCCVVEYHRRRRLYHLFMAQRIRHFAATDDAKATSYVLSEVALTPGTAGQRAAVIAAMDFVLAPHTGLAMCRPCATDTNSPAQRLSAQYRVLAQAAGIEDLLSNSAGILSSRI